MKRQDAAQIEDLLRDIRTCEYQLQQIERVLNPDKHEGSQQLNSKYYRVRLENMGEMLGDYDITENEVRDFLNKVGNRIAEKLDALKLKLEKL